jgi:hypothetical protein
MAYTTGDVDLKLRFTSEKEVDVNFIAQEATSIWRLMRSRKITFGDKDKTDAFMNEVQKNHPEFCKSYPVVNRYICEMQEYDEKTFRLWLTKISRNPWKTEDEYLEAQADYVTMLFRAKKPRSNQTERNAVRTNILAMLKTEHEKFKHYAKEFEREVSAEVDVLRDRNMDELHAFAKLAGCVGMSKAETIRVETDLTPKFVIDIDSLIADETAVFDVRNESATVLSICADDLLS